MVRPHRPNGPTPRGRPSRSAGRPRLCRRPPATTGRGARPTRPRPNFEFLAWPSGRVACGARRRRRAERRVAGGPRRPDDASDQESVDPGERARPAPGPAPLRALAAPRPARVEERRATEPKGPRRHEQAARGGGRDGTQRATRAARRRTKERAGARGAPRKRASNFVECRMSETRARAPAAAPARPRRRAPTRRGIWNVLPRATRPGPSPSFFGSAEPAPRALGSASATRRRSASAGAEGAANAQRVARGPPPPRVGPAAGDPDTAPGRAAPTRRRATSSGRPSRAMQAGRNGLTASAATAQSHARSYHARLTSSNMFPFFPEPNLRIWNLRLRPAAHSAGTNVPKRPTSGGAPPAWSAHGPEHSLGACPGEPSAPGPASGAPCTEIRRVGERGHGHAQPDVRAAAVGPEETGTRRAAPASARSAAAARQRVAQRRDAVRRRRAREAVAHPVHGPGERCQSASQWGLRERRAERNSRLAGARRRISSFVEAQRRVEGRQQRREQGGDSVCGARGRGGGFEFLEFRISPSIAFLPRSGIARAHAPHDASERSRTASLCAGALAAPGLASASARSSHACPRSADRLAPHREQARGHGLHPRGAREGRNLHRARAPPPA